MACMGLGEDAPTPSPRAVQAEGARTPGRARPVLGVRVRARLVGLRGVARLRILDRLRDAPQLLEVRRRVFRLVDDVEDEPVDLLPVLVGAAAGSEADALEQVLGLARALQGSQELLLVNYTRTYVQRDP